MKSIHSIEERIKTGLAKKSRGENGRGSARDEAGRRGYILTYWSIRTLSVFGGVWLVMFLPCLLFADRAGAAEPMGPLSGLLFPETDSIDYQVREALAIHSQDPDILENRLRAIFLPPSASSNTWSIRQSVDLLRFSNSPVIPQTGAIIPRDLWNIETGVGLEHRLGDRYGWGFSLGVGTATNEPYDSIYEMTLRATGTYRIPSGEKNSWLFMLSYSNNRYFANGIPLPGVAYVIHSPEHGLDAVIGFPFLAISYRPTPKLSGRLSIFGPSNVSAESDYLFWKSLQVYAGFDWNHREWAPSDRTDLSQRLFFDEKKESLGIRFPLAESLRVDLSGTYEFNRRIYENKNAVSGGVPATNFAPALSFQGKLSMRW